MTISVALGAYNGASYLSEQLAGIARQDCLPHELVVCDDASSDASAAIVKQFAATAPFPVRLQVNPRNLGSRANFAQAIGLCRGSWIALSDQDDVWRPNKLRRLTEAAEQNPAAGLVFSDARLIDQRGAPLGERLWDAIHFTRGERRRLQRGREAAVLLRHNVVTGATMMFQARWRELILPIADGWVHDGWIALLVAAVSRIVGVAEPLIDYRQHPRQQIGERKRSVYERYLRAKRKTPTDMLLVAENFAAAYERLSAVADQLRDRALLAALRAKAAHFRCKAAMRDPQRRRLPLILGELLHCRYARYSTGWRSLAQDLFC